MPNACIETERLLLRALTPNDVDAIFAVIADKVGMQYFPRTYTREDAVEWVQRNIRRCEEHGYGLFAAVLKSNGVVIGDCGLTRQMVDDVPMLEVGYHFQRVYWGNGYATEAARACMKYAFEELGADEVISLIRPENVPSRRVAERNGMRAERETMHAGVPHLVYGMKRSSWQVASYQ